MARAAKRKKTTGTAAGMASMRDAAMVRDMNFNKINKIMNDIGPGSGKPNEELMMHQIDTRGSQPNLLGDYMGSFVNVMFLDLIAPGYFTPGKLDQWKEIAKEIATENKERSAIYTTFSRISKQMGLCSKRMTDLIHFEASDEDLKYAIYDVILKISMEHSIDLKGMLPTI